MICYSILLAETVWRFLAKRPVKPFRFRKTREIVPVEEGELSPDAVRKAKILIAAMVFSTTLIFIRSIYRTIELLDGWTGPVISNEMLFCVLDGLMVLLATAIFVPIHPAYFLPAWTVYRSTAVGEAGHKGVNGTQGEPKDLERATGAVPVERSASGHSSRTLAPENQTLTNGNKAQ